MMRWNTKKGTIDAGSIELNNVIFNEDHLEVCIDIYDMSEELKAEVKNAVELEKIKYSKEWDKILAEHEEFMRYSTKWSDKPVIMSYTYLRVRIEAGKAIDYSIEFGFTDAEDRFMEAWGGSITVDLSAYANELKKAVIKVLIDKFF